MSGRLLTVLVCGGVVMGLTGWWLRPRFTGGNPAEFRFMHCDKCGQEMTYNPALAGRQCSHCTPPYPGRFIPTKGSVKDGESLDPWKWMKVALAVESVALLAVVVFLLYHPPAATASSSFQYMQCPSCGRRLKYAASSAGSAGVCPRCKARIFFEAMDEE